MVVLVPVPDQTARATFNLTAGAHACACLEFPPRCVGCSWGQGVRAVRQHSVSDRTARATLNLTAGAPACVLGLALGGCLAAVQDALGLADPPRNSLPAHPQPTHPLCTPRTLEPRLPMNPTATPWLES